MLTLIIAFLIQFGFITNEQDYHQLDTTTQQDYYNIIIVDIETL